jgi:hypothetical protein
VNPARAQPSLSHAFRASIAGPAARTARDIAALAGKDM